MSTTRRLHVQEEKNGFAGARAVWIVRVDILNINCNLLALLASNVNFKTNSM